MGDPVMSRRIKYPNARSVAYAVKSVMSSRGMVNVAARPWNMYDPENTFWWLVPHTEWPAYNHGKFFFSPDRAPKGFLFCGLHIEKGLDPSVSEAYPSRGGKRLIPVLQIHHDSQSELPQVRQAGRLPRLLPRLRENRKHNGCQYGDDDYDDQQLDESETGPDLPSCSSGLPPFGHAQGRPSYFILNAAKSAIALATADFILHPSAFILSTCPAYAFSHCYKPPWFLLPPFA